MWAFWGFTVAALFFGVFAYTFDAFVVQETKLKLSKFAAAYYCLALALFTWGIASAVGGKDTLRQSIILSDGLLLSGTLFMLSVWLGDKRRDLVSVAAVVAAAMVYIRAQHYPPVPYLKNGILIFNTQRPVAVVLGLIFVLIWLPVNLKVARLVTDKIKQKSIRSTYSMIYILATGAALGLIGAKRTVTVVLSFLALTICFAMLIGSNWLVKTVEEKSGRSK